MSKFLSGRQSNLKLGVAGYTESKTVLETTGKVGIGTTDAQSYSLFVVGDTNVTGLVSATAFYGDGSNLENTGATLSAAAGTQRLVVTSLTSGTMVDAATDSDLTFNATTNTLNTDNLIVAGNLTVSGDQTILNTTSLEVEDINIGIASANPKLNDAQLDGAGITIHGLNGDKTLTWDNSNSRLGFNTDVNVANLKLDDNQKATFGDNDDFQIFHHSNGTGIIQNAGSGQLQIRSNEIRLLNQATDEDYAFFRDDGAVELYYDNSKKFETTGIGVSIYDDLNVGTAVTVYGNAGIVSAISFYGDGSNLTNTGATLSATSGTERLVTTQLTSGTMVDAATDADLTFDAGSNLLHTPKIDAAGLSPDGTNFGVSGYVPVADGSGGWVWGNLQGASSVNTILNGFTVSEEGNVVGTAGSITQLDFRGVNVLASADPQPNGIATVSILLNQSLDSLDVSGIATFRGPVSNGSTTGNVGQYLRSTGVGVTWASFPTLRVVGINTASAGQSTFNFSYNVDFLDVFVNGVKLTPSEYTATNGNQIVLNTPAFADEIVEFHSYNTASTYGGGGGGGGGASNLNGLTDVTISTLADGQLLQYNSSSGEWENISAATVVGAASSFATKSATASTATAGQTTFSGTYTVGFVDVFLNGVKQSEDQYTATTGTNVVLNDGASEGDLIEVVGLTANVPGSGGGGGSSYTNSDVDAHLNRSTATTGQVLSWNGSDYDWVAQSGGGGGGGISLTDLSVTQNSVGTAALTYNNTNGVFSYTPPDLSSYLTSYTETDTLATVTGRGSSTNSNLIFGGNLSVSGVSTFTTDKVFFKNGGTPLPATLQIETGVAGVGNTIRSSNTLDLVTNGSTFKLELDTTNAIISGGTGAAQYVQLYGAGLEKLKTIGTGVTVTGTTFSNQLSVSGISTLSNVTVGGASTEMVVDGDLRVTGIITTGTGSVTIDGNTNEIIVGTGVTIYGNTGIVSATEVASNSLQFTKNNVTIAGTAGTAGQFKQIGGAPFYYDGTAWREIVLSDGTPVTTSADTDWDNVLLRLDFEQASTDVSLIENRKVLFDGNDQNPDSPRDTVVDLTSSPVKFGSKALRFNGTTTAMPFAWQNRQSANNDVLFDFEGPFTLELWIYVASADLPGSTSPMPIVSQSEIANSPTNDWALSLTYPGSGSVYNFNWYNQNHGTSAVNSNFGQVVGDIGNTAVSDQWNHIALVREAGDSSIHFYLNGTESQYTNGVTSTLVDTTVNWGSTSDYLSFGYHYNMAGQQRVFKGVMDDIRLSKSARYTSNFTAPTAAHPISGTSTTVYTPPGSKQGEIALGSTPVWTGTTGVTVSQVASGQYRMTFASAFASNTAYSVNANAMNYDPATSIVGVGVSRVSSSACDFYVRRLSDNALVDTGSLAVNVYKK